jgi:hypothetical protein
VVSGIGPARSSLPLCPSANYSSFDLDILTGLLAYCLWSSKLSLTLLTELPREGLSRKPVYSFADHYALGPGLCAFPRLERHGRQTGIKSRGRGRALRSVCLNLRNPSPPAWASHTPLEKTTRS